MGADSSRRDAALVGGGFGFLGGLVALLLALLLTWIRGPSPTLPPGTSTLALHAGYIPIYLASGALLGRLWPIRRIRRGRWTLWLIGCATGALTVNSLSHGAWWRWSLLEWGYYLLVAICFTPVFAWPDRHRPAAP